MSTLQRALEIAVAAHAGQVQHNGDPYVLHPIALMMSVDGDDARVVALLHDVVEDTDWTLDGLRAEGFSETVLAALDRLTHRDGEDYAAYVERIAADPLASAVKRADLRDNMNLRRLPHLHDKDLDRMRRYHAAWRRLGGDASGR